MILFFLAITTVEGILQRTVAGLKQDQPVRRVLDEEGANQIDEFCLKVEALNELKEPFTLVSKVIFRPNLNDGTFACVDCGFSRI